MKCFTRPLIISFLFINNIQAQDCKVSAEAIKGTYTGDCKDGKANGKGKSVGTDTYEGEFKNGMPDGYGEYTWSNKEVYKGNFKKGDKDGQGEMKFISKAGKDSTVTGFWKKNKYIGLYEKPYLVGDKTTKINRVDFSLARNTQQYGVININTYMISGSDAPEITDITILAGDYVTKSGSLLGKSAVTRLQQVTFPFRARFRYSNGEMVDISFNEKAEYEISVGIL